MACCPGPNPSGFGHANGSPLLVCAIACLRKNRVAALAFLFQTDGATLA